jgi:ribosomal protein S18 acetylase RimI-like enzyme
MTADLVYRVGTATASEISGHFCACDAEFVRHLRERVEIEAYARKLAERSTTFEARSGAILVGLVAAYVNDLDRRIAYITSVSVLPSWKGRGIAATLIGQCIEHARLMGMIRVGLEVAADNAVAIKLYEKTGFVLGKSGSPFVTMSLAL